MWTTALRSLKARGLTDVRVVTFDVPAGLADAVRECMTGASWQRCRVRCARNLLACLPNASQERSLLCSGRSSRSALRPRARLAGTKSGTLSESDAAKQRSRCAVSAPTCRRLHRSRTLVERIRESGLGAYGDEQANTVRFHREELGALDSRTLTGVVAWAIDSL